MKVVLPLELKLVMCLRKLLLNMVMSVVVVGGVGVLIVSGVHLRIN